MRSRTLLRVLLTLVLALAGSVVSVTIGATAAHADACYTWTRTLSQGSSGEDVRQLQIRVAGYPGYHSLLTLDGDYGPATAAAVTRFQQAYGLVADGIAGSQTFNKIYALQDADCTPVHFSYSELNYNCGAYNFEGGAVSPATARSNALKVMWRLEALRHALGDRPLTITSGFRSYACNSSVGGASDSQHLYGTAADIGPSGIGLCTIANQARYRGFGGIFGPGYPGHSDHVHVDIRTSFSWSAPNCGI